MADAPKAPAAPAAPKQIGTLGIVWGSLKAIWYIATHKPGDPGLR